MCNSMDASDSNNIGAKMDDVKSHAIEIYLDGPTRSSIKIDGQDISSYVRGVSMKSSVENGAVVSLDFVARDVKITGVADVTTFGSQYVKKAFVGIDKGKIEIPVDLIATRGGENATV